MNQKLRDQIVLSVEDGFDEQIAYTQELIRLRYRLRGDEHTIRDLVFHELRSGKRFSYCSCRK